MYYTMLQKRLSRSKPFHQKVLRFQYEIPLTNLKKAFELSSVLFKKPLYMAEDRTENGLLSARQKAAFDISLFQPSDETKVFGIFDETESFYIRVQIDALENAKSADLNCGNLAIFASDDLLIELAKAFQNACLGQVLLEGTSDYFSLLDD